MFANELKGPRAFCMGLASRGKLLLLLVQWSRRDDSLERDDALAGCDPLSGINRPHYEAHPGGNPQKATLEGERICRWSHRRDPRVISRYLRTRTAHKSNGADRKRKRRDWTSVSERVVESV